MFGQETFWSHTSHFHPRRSGSAVPCGRSPGIAAASHSDSSLPRRFHCIPGAGAAVFRREWLDRQAHHRSYGRTQNPPQDRNYMPCRRGHSIPSSLCDDDTGFHHVMCSTHIPHWQMNWRAHPLNRPTKTEMGGFIWQNALLVPTHIPLHFLALIVSYISPTTTT